MQPQSQAGAVSDPAVREARIIAQVGPLVAAESDPVRQARLLTRAAAAIGAGRAIVWEADRRTGHLLALAMIDGLAGPADPFAGGASGVTGMPQVRSLAPGEGVSGTVAQRGEMILCQDATRCPPDVLAVEAERLGIAPAAIVCLPLPHRGAVIGVLTVAQPAPASRFAPHTLAGLRSLAAQATLVLALTNSERELRQERARLANLQEEERRRLARELHDGPAQSVAHAVMSLELLDQRIVTRPDEARIELRRLYQRLAQTARDLRGMLFDLRPLALESEGLTAALRQLVERFEEQGAPPIQLIVDLPERLPPDIESAVYLIAREALNNVLKHARASACRVEVRRLEHAVAFAVRDNGVGFDPEQVLAQYPQGQSWGLLTMHERVRGLTDRFAIRARPGQGTTIEVEIPLNGG